MTRRVFVLYVPGHLTEIHRNQVWVALPRAFRKLGYHSCLVCYKYEVREDFDLRIIETFIPRNQFERLMEPFLAFHRIIKERPDLVVISPIGSYVFTQMSLIIFTKLIGRLRGFRAKFVLKTDWSLDYTGMSLAKRSLASLLLVASSYVFDAITIETTCGLERAKKLPLFNSKRAHVVPLASPFDFRIKYEEEERENVLLCVARVLRMKGLDVLIRAFSALKEEFPDWRLSFVGPILDVDYKRELDSLVKAEGLEGRVEFRGFIAPKDERLRDAYKRAAIFVLPSLQESFGIAKCEATAFGLPVVTTDVPCGKDNEESGWIVARAGNHVDLAEKLRPLMSSRELRKKTVEKAQARLVTHDDIARRYVEIVGLV
ncbi:MAG: glycosyltransferase family 4 protein [Infirmifilum sp.]